MLVLSCIALNVLTAGLGVFFLLSRRSQHLRDSVVHPFLIYIVLSGVINFDFYYAFTEITGLNKLYLGNFPIRDISIIRQGYIWYTLFNISFAISAFVAFGLFTISRPITISGSDASKDIAAFSGFLTFTVTLFVAGATTIFLALISLQSGSIFFINSVRQIFFKDYPALFLMVLFFLTSSIFLISRSGQSLRLLSLLMLLALAILVILGSRTQSFFLLFGLITIIHLSKYRLRSFFILPAFLAVGTLIVVLRFFQRVSLQGFTFSEMLSDEEGVIAMLFGSPEIGFAESISIIVSEDFQRTPFSSIVAFASFLIPRSLMMSKPYSASTFFTMEIDPWRWYYFQSEILTTGFGDLYLEFGPAALLFCVLLGFIWGLVVTLAVKARSISTITLLTVYSVIVLFIFIRADIYVLAFYMWPLCLYLIIDKFISAPIARTILGRRRKMTRGKGYIASSRLEDGTDAARAANWPGSISSSRSSRHV